MDCGYLYQCCRRFVKSILSLCKRLPWDLTSAISMVVTRLDFGLKTSSNRWRAKFQPPISFVIWLSSCFIGGKNHEWSFTTKIVFILCYWIRIWNGSPWYHCLLRLKQITPAPFRWWSQIVKNLLIIALAYAAFQEIGCILWLSRVFTRRWKVDRPCWSRKFPKLRQGSDLASHLCDPYETPIPDQL